MQWRSNGSKGSNRFSPQLFREDDGGRIELLEQLERLEPERRRSERDAL